ncbi:YjbH domain-containing protein [Geobacter sp. DSM 9736]|uniref:YjbH domain-containing protein n=1 Tax=Geobacter sp. DSM 9736 TaxID=1277350 RepID=UPI000B50B921|nr:YjbH domain-containing protein [Geobacter sp. DSM 9736]SNB45134.1 Exopolysaccharide biosynthesis protein YbjH [Geobacter sp. DSM 9736]
MKIDLLRILLCFLSFTVFFLNTTEPKAEEFHNALSMQGFTGLLNIPTAEVTEEGKVYLLYSNQKERKWRGAIDHQDNYLVSFGLLPFLELTARFTEAPSDTSRYISDLSGNAKLKMPFIPEDSWLPQLALGVQDVTGGKKDQHDAKKLNTWYGVASKQVSILRLTAGYGTGPDRMEGFFGGIEAKAFDWLYGIGEYDAEEFHGGLRLVTPHLFGYPVNLQITAKTNFSHRPERPDFAIGMQFPIGTDRTKSAAALKPLPQTPAAHPPEISAVPTTEITTPSTDAAPSAHFGTAANLQARLTEYGFQNVRVGTRGSDLLVVEYENNIFNHNELDGLGVVLGTTTDIVPAGFSTLRLIVKKKGICILQISAPLEAFASFMKSASPGRLQSSLKVTPEIEEDGDVQYTSPGNPSWLTSSLMIQPGLRTYLGTEVSSFDYLLSLKPELFINTWKGGVIDARADIPLTWSRNFDTGRAFRNDRKDSQLDRLMLFQALKPVSTLMLNLGAGMVVHNLYGTLNEAMWTPGAGKHRFRLIQLYGENARGSRRMESYLAGYRYYFSQFDTCLEGTAGKFFPEDRGAVVELKRFFGDTAITVFYKNSEAADGRSHQAGGIQLEIPLTPRRDMKPRLVQVRGTENFSYEQETEIAGEGSLNFLGTPIGIRPETAFNLERVFYNKDRLSESYIRKHLLRLREAYVTFTEKK